MWERVQWHPEICAPYFARLEHGQKNIDCHLSMLMYAEVMFLSSTEIIFGVVRKGFFVPSSASAVTGCFRDAKLLR